jgi:hypothetical protein
MSQACTFTHSQTAQYFHPTPWTQKTQFHPQKAVTRMSLRVDQTPLLPPEAGLNLNLDSYQCNEQCFQFGSRAFPGSFVQLELTGREAPSPESTWSSGAWQAGEVEPTIRRWKHHHPNPRWCPQKCCRRTQKLRGHQSFQEASLLSKLAVTQQTHGQRLSPKNKGGFPYISFRAGYRNGWGVQLVPYIITCHCIGHCNLWGKVTFLWSSGKFPQL